LQTDDDGGGGGQARECLDLTDLDGCCSLHSLNLAKTGLGGTLRIRTVSLPPSLTIINACFCAFTTLELDASGGPCHLDALYLNNNAGLASSERLDVCALGMLSVNRLDLGGTSIACTFPTTADAVPAARRARPFFMLICGPRDNEQQRAEMLALLRASNQEARLRFFPPSAWQQLGIGYEEWEDEEVRSSRKAAEEAAEDDE
jgi:hypothetical protein